MSFSFDEFGGKMAPQQIQLGGKLDYFPFSCGTMINGPSDKMREGRRL